LATFSTDFPEVFNAGGQRKAYLMALLRIESRWADAALIARFCQREQPLP